MNYGRQGHLAEYDPLPTNNSFRNVNNSLSIRKVSCFKEIKSSKNPRGNGISCVSMATHNGILMNGNVPTKSIISQLFLSVDYSTWYQIQAYTYDFHRMVRYENYRICIFMNINETVRNVGKIVIKKTCILTDFSPSHC